MPLAIGTALSNNEQRRTDKLPGRQHRAMRVRPRFSAGCPAVAVRQEFDNEPEIRMVKLGAWLKVRPVGTTT